MTRDSIIIYRSWYEAIKELDADVKVSLYEAIIHYGLNQEEPKLHGIAQVVWQLIKPNVDANYRKWENGQKGAQHGGKGGRPKKPQGNPTETPQGIEEETPKKPQRNPKRTPNVNVNVNVNDNENENVDALRVARSRPSTKWTKDEFIAECKQVTEQNENRLPRQERKPFVDYWTESDGNGKMRFQAERFFDAGRRMDTWNRRSNKNNFEVAPEDKMTEQKRIRLEIESKYGIEPGGPITKDMVPREQWAVMGMDKMI